MAVKTLRQSWPWFALSFGPAAIVAWGAAVGKLPGWFHVAAWGWSAGLTWIWLSRQRFGAQALPEAAASDTANTGVSVEEAVDAALQPVAEFADAFALRLMGDILAHPGDGLDGRPEHQALARVWSLYEDQMEAQSAPELSSGMLAVSERGTILEINQAAVVMLGFANAGELVGDDVSRVFNDHTAAARLRDELSQVSSDGLVLAHSFQRNGVQATLELNLGPRSQPFRCTILVADITERIALETEMRKARDLALSHEKQTSEFLANMSHELRTPMNGVIGMAELLGDTSLTEEQTELVHMLKSSGEHLLCIINDILDLSKLEAGHVDIESVNVDVPDMMQVDLAALEVIAADRGLDLFCEIGADVPSFLSLDPLRVKQVITNLVSNALKFTEQGGVTVRCSRASTDGYLLLEVEDTGLGIPSEKISGLFESFVQADASTARRFGGTGLGLTICKKLAECMGGTIGARSEVGIGSTFFFTLPLSNTGVSMRQRFQLSAPSKVGLAAPTRILRDVVLTGLSVVGAPVAVGTTAEALEGCTALLVELEALSIEQIDVLAAALGLSPALVGVMLSLGNRAGRAEVQRRGYRPLRRGPDAGALKAHLEGQAFGDRRQESVPAGTRAQPTQLRGKILVAEDNPVNQKLVTKLLTNLGAEVLLAADGEEAVALASQHADIALILMDCQMPNMDGFEATRIIRQRTPALPICALTANAMSSDRERCFAAGMNDYLTKPIRKKELASTLEQWLKP